MPDLEKNNERQNFSENEKKTKNNHSGMVLYIGVGITLGAAFGLLFDNIAIGVGLGVAIGAAIDANIANKNKKQQ